MAEFCPENLNRKSSRGNSRKYFSEKKNMKFRGKIIAQDFSEKLLTTFLGAHSGKRFLKLSSSRNFPHKILRRLLEEIFAEISIKFQKIIFRKKFWLKIF